MFQDGLHLSPGNPGEPLKEVIDGRAVFEVGKQGADGHTEIGRAHV
mgnify:CR=1 FL=1